LQLVFSLSQLGVLLLHLFQQRLTSLLLQAPSSSAGDSYADSNWGTFAASKASSSLAWAVHCCSCAAIEARSPASRRATPSSANNVAFCSRSYNQHI
jgi:hypothetical protein